MIAIVGGAAAGLAWGWLVVQRSLPPLAAPAVVVAFALEAFLLASVASAAALCAGAVGGAAARRLAAALLGNSYDTTATP